MLRHWDRIPRSRGHYDRSYSIDKLPIFAGLAIPEVWRFDGRSLTILRLANEDYVEVDASETLPGVTARDLNAHIESARTLPRGKWVKQLREWAATLRAGASGRT